LPADLPEKLAPCIIGWQWTGVDPGHDFYDQTGF
jgi:hypothetical protein